MKTRLKKFMQGFLDGYRAHLYWRATRNLRASRRKLAAQQEASQRAYHYRGLPASKRPIKRKH